MSKVAQETGHAADQRIIASSLQRLPEHMRNHIAIIVYPSFRILYLNPAARNMLQLQNLASWENEVWNNFLSNGSQQTIEETFSQMNDGDDWRGEIEIHPKTGSPFPAMALVNASIEGDSAAKILTILCRDLTASKAAEEERKQIELELNLARKMETIGRLTASIAHEFNTPMQCLQYDLEFLESSIRRLTNSLGQALENREVEGSQPTQNGDLISNCDALEEVIAETRETLEQSKANVSNASRIVAALRAFALAKREGKSPVSINEMIEATLLICRQEWIEKIETNTNLEDDLPLVNCHSDQINQVLLNVIVNAIRSIKRKLERDSQAEATIRISSRKTGNAVLIEIMDTGVGIRQEEQALIFKQTYSSRKNGIGSGQGLALCKSIIEKNHSGKLRVSSELDQGATFSIEIPI